MIPRRIVMLVILAVIVVGGAIIYAILNRKVKDVESDLVLREGKEIKGRK